MKIFIKTWEIFQYMVGKKKVVGILVFFKALENFFPYSD